MSEKPNLFGFFRFSKAWAIGNAAYPKTRNYPSILPSFQTMSAFIELLTSLWVWCKAGVLGFSSESKKSGIWVPLSGTQSPAPPDLKSGKNGRFLGLFLMKVNRLKTWFKEAFWAICRWNIEIGLKKAKCAQKGISKPPIAGPKAQKSWKVGRMEG